MTNRLYTTVIKPTLPMLSIVGLLCTTLSLAIALKYWNEINFNPSLFITEVIRTGIATTILFLLVEYQKSRTEHGKEEYVRLLFLEKNLLQHLQSLHKLLSEFKEGNESKKKLDITKMEEMWLIFYTNFNTQKLQPLPNTKAEMFVLPSSINIQKINDSFKQILWNEDDSITDRKREEILVIINHINLFKS